MGEMSTCLIVSPILTNSPILFSPPHTHTDKTEVPKWLPLHPVAGGGQLQKSPQGKGTFIPLPRGKHSTEGSTWTCTSEFGGADSHGPMQGSWVLEGG